MSSAQQQKELFEKNAKTFSYAAKFLGHSRASKIFVLYEFCRVIDNIADESADPKAAKKTLSAYRNDIEKGASSDDYLAGFIDFLKNEGLERQYAIELLDGVIGDCHDSIRIKTTDDLIQYCYQVAGTVGGLMCPLLGVRACEMKNAQPAAIHLGIAMQLTNISRDIKEDAQNDRIYIPQSWISVEPSELLTRRPERQEDDARLACVKLLNLADHHYSAAKQGYAFLPFNSRFTIMIAANLYRAIGLKIKKNKYKYWEERAFTRKIEKISHSIFSLPEIFMPHFWMRSSQKQTPYQKPQIDVEKI